MAQRTDPFHGSAGGAGAAAAGPLPFDLDWELQRLLSDEAEAMEPERNARPAPAPAAPAEVQADAAPAQAAPAAPAMQEEADDLARRLWLDIEATYQSLNSGGTRRATTTEVSDLLAGARAALLRGPAGVGEAEKLTRRAQGLLQVRDDSRLYSSTYGVGILLFEFACLLIFVAILLFDRPLTAWASIITRSPGAGAMRDILPFWDTMIWGGIGGVLGAFFTLCWHVVVLQDFDRRFNLWYILQPLMGSVLGAFIYLVLMSVMLALRADIASAAGWFPAALACLCGFRQKYIFDWLDKLMQVIGLRRRREEAAKK